MSPWCSNGRRENTKRESGGAALRRWRKTSPQNFHDLLLGLILRKEDAQLAEALVRKQLNVLGKDLEFNITHVDVPSVTGSFDLLGYFRKVAFNCGGTLWGELKAFSVASYDKSVREQKEELPKRFEREKKKNASLCGVLLVCAKVGKSGKDWGEPAVTVSLWRAETNTWQNLFFA